MSSHLTLDYGLRFVHQLPQFDGYHKNANFIPEKWELAQASRLFEPACVTGTTCTGNNRRAKNPVTGEIVNVAALGTIVPNTGDIQNGVYGTGNYGFPNEGVIADTSYLYPTLGYAPRVGAAWDVRGDQRFVVRGGGGLFFDRPASNTIYNTVNNPPYTRNVTVRYGLLGDLAKTGLATEGAPSINAFQYEIPLPKSSQWNAELQSALPFALTGSFAYTGSHDFDTLAGVNINNIDLGMAYDPKLQDPTTTAGGTSNSLVTTNPESAPLLPGIREHLAAAAERLANVSLRAVDVEPPAPQRLPLRVHGHGQPVRQAGRRQPHPA